MVPVWHGQQLRSDAQQKRRDAWGGGRRETTIAIESHTEVVEMEGDPEELARKTRLSERLDLPPI